MLMMIATIASLVAQLPPAQPGDPMVITCGNDVGWQVTDPQDALRLLRETGQLRRDTAAVIEHWSRLGPEYARHGVTAFEPYVKWGLLEPAEGLWDPEFYDAELAQFRAHGLKWVPFLIAGPAYATPPWFKESAESVFAVDLGTGDISRDQSIWNPHLKPRIRAWLERFFAHYDTADMQAVLLGISGVFGESIYTAGGNLWTHIWDGPYPQHFGWWCGDDYARTDFRAAMEAKYGDIDALNAAWAANLTSFSELEPFVPSADHPNRARLDMIRWYMGAMTDYAEWWAATVREIAPHVPILMCTGGHASPELGADMAAQTKAMARHGAGMRITNEASDYAANYHLTRHISSASRLYGTYFGYEPAGEVSTDGIVARVYNALASGAWELFHYDNPPQGERGERYLRYLPLMTLREPVVDVGLFWSRTSTDLYLAPDLAATGAALRDVADLEYIDELMIADGALHGLPCFVWGSGSVTEPETAQAIHDAVQNGMILLVPAGWSPRSPEGRPLFPSEHVSGVPTLGRVAVTSLPTAPGVGIWREGLFHPAEPDTMWHSGGTVCWTGGPVRLHLPEAGGKRLRFPYRTGLVDQPVRIRANDELVATLEPRSVGEVDLQLRGPAGADVVLAIDSDTWSPAEEEGTGDTRRLAVLLQDLIIGDDPAPVAPVAQVTSIGNGWLVESTVGGAGGLADALAALIPNAPDYGIPPFRPELAAGAPRDGLYLTVTTQDLLLYNQAGEAVTVTLPAGPVTVPSHDIVTVAR